MWTWVTIYSVTVCLGSCSLSVQFLQSSVTMFTITRHHPFHLTTFMVSATDLETLTYPGPHAVHQHELNKWYEFKSNEAIWGYGQFFSVSPPTQKLSVNKYFIALHCVTLSVPYGENGLFYDQSFFREGLKKGTKIKGGVQKIKFSSK